MGEWGWQGYNLLQTACGQRRGGRDSDTEREQAKERASGGGGSEDKHGRNELAGEKEYRKEIKKNKKRREGEVEVRCERCGFVYLSDVLLYPLSSPLPPIVMPSSVGASKAANSSDIYVAFSSLR